MDNENIKKITIKDIEPVLLVFFVVLLFWLGGNTLLQGSISHEFPTGYFASDSYWQLVGATHTYEAGDYGHRPFYDSLGYKDVLGVLPPFMYHLSAGFAHLTGLAPFDSLIFLALLLLCMSSLIGYLIIRHINKNMAILSLPFMLLLVSKTNMYVITFGKHLVVAGGFFLITGFFLMTKEEKKNMWILLSIISGAIFISHPPEFFFFIGFIIIYHLLRLFTGKFSFDSLKKHATSIVIGLVLATGYTIIFFGTMIGKGAKTINPFHAQLSPGYPVIYLTDFGWALLSILILGLIIISINWLKTRKTAIIISIFMLFLGLSNYIGVMERSFQQRYFWPVYLSLFFGAFIYYIIFYIIKKTKTKEFLFPIVLIVALLSGIIITSYFYEPVYGPGLMSKPMWDAFSWLKTNTAKEDIILYVYGDTFSQKPFLLSSGRRAHLIDTNSLVSDAKKGIIKPVQLVGEVMNHDALLSYRTGLFSFKKHYVRDQEIMNKSMCDYRYVLFTESSKAPVFIQYTNIIRNKLLKQESINEVYRNQYVSILKNNNPEEKCFNEQKIA